jgi:hypothetical protein
LQPLKKSLARIEARLAETDAPSRPTIPISEPISESPPTEESHDALLSRLELLSAEMADFRRRTLELLEKQPAPPVAATVVSPAAAEAPAMEFSAGPIDLWEEIIFGGELSADESLSAIRQQFLDDVINGTVSARALAGQLLLLQATPVEELPERFRHVGEAYYRWRPRTTTADDPLEQALANWLTRRSEEAGLRNSIQVVRPGDRFDSTRHAASTRGVEVTAVHGWVVLRDNAKVYTKASVSVQ